MGMSQNGNMIEFPKMIKISKSRKKMRISKNRLNAGNFQRLNLKISNKFRKNEGNLLKRK
jgi:hypothetical protein